MCAGIPCPALHTATYERDGRLMSTYLFYSIGRSRAAPPALRPRTRTYTCAPTPSTQTALHRIATRGAPRRRTRRLSAPNQSLCARARNQRATPPDRRRRRRSQSEESVVGDGPRVPTDEFSLRFFFHIRAPPCERGRPPAPRRAHTIHEVSELLFVRVHLPLRRARPRTIGARWERAGPLRPWRCFSRGAPKSKGGGGTTPV